MVKIFIEGGGDGKDLRGECRKGFTKFLEKSGLKGKMPEIIACGARGKAYKHFCMAVKSGVDAILLVDSEAAVSSENQQGAPDTWKPWRHLQDKDGWTKPTQAEETDCHLMAQIMETWFLADRQTLGSYFGNGFMEKQFSATGNALEEISKKQVLDALDAATTDCKSKGKYGKGAHSFELLAHIDPAKVQAQSPWAKRFIDQTKKKMGAR